jgi:DNA polymerase I-like protein with 3'-5' exonuclease and polymerase domains
MEGLFGADFELEITKPKSEVKKLVKKLEADSTKPAEVNAEKMLKSKKLSLQDRLAIINEKVIKILGKQRHNTIVIRSLNDFSDYISKAIIAGRIAVDTETNNSLDPITCKLMGLCLYVPGEKQAYIPINHINNDTGELLPNQLTEADCKAQLQRILDAKAALKGGWAPDYEGQSYAEWYSIHVGASTTADDVKIIMHNGKFDYKVIKCTCDIPVVPDWDTMLAAKILDENEFSAGLKQQYISKIDPSQEKYSIDHLFENVEYAQVDPEIFALYAATDSMMTDKLYLWQKPHMEEAEAENPDLNIYKLFKEVEMPCVQVVAEMELAGINFDVEYADRLRLKYEAQLADIDAKIDAELARIADKIEAWKKTPDALNPARVYVADKSKMSQEKIEATYPYLDTTLNKRYKVGKAKIDQLEEPISLSSPTQLAILFYDILGLSNKAKDRSTGEDALTELSKKSPIANLLLERRGVVKLLDAFINSLPKKVNPKTGKIHCSFHQYGAATGRFSSSEPNLQQVPSHAKNIRMLFTADTTYNKIPVNDDCFVVPASDEVETLNGWKSIKDLVVGDVLKGEDTDEIIMTIEQRFDNTYLIYTKEAEFYGTHN